jgi:hypothetical protein
LTSFQCLVHLCASAAHRCWWCTPSRTCNTRSFALVILSSFTRADVRTAVIGWI